MRQGAAAGAMLLAAGCAAPAPPSPPPSAPVILSTRNPAANAGTIATFFRQTCLHAPTDERRLAASIAASRWAVREMREQDPNEPPIWRFDHGGLIWFRQMATCLLTLDSLVAPTPAALGTALRPFVQRPGFEARTEDDDQVIWAWPAGGNHRMVLTIDVILPSPGRTYGAGRQAVSLHLVREPMPAASAERE